jgi:predicted regulator of Ras-like GTPase activity (Roadblock/LC7/MglB family)
MLLDQETFVEMDPRVQSLTDTLARLEKSELDFQWAALVDYDGLVLANYPAESNGNIDLVMASSAHLMRMGEKAQDLMDFGKWRYTLLAGASMQQIVLHLNNEVALTVGYGPKIPLHRTFSALRDVVPDIMRSLDINNRKMSGPNTMILKREDLERMINQ